MDLASKRVRFPASLIQSALEQAPKEIKLYGRDIAQVIHLREDSVYYSTSGYAVQFFDPATRTRKEIKQADLAWLTRLADGLDQVDIYALLGTPGGRAPGNQ